MVKGNAPPDLREGRLLFGQVPYEQMKGIGALLTGMALGALAVVLVQKLQEHVAHEDPESLSDRISAQLDQLEKATQRLTD